MFDEVIVQLCTECVMIFINGDIQNSHDVV